MRLCLPILEVLSHRGIKDPEHFLRQPTWQDLPSAFSIAGVSDGVARLRRAIEERERVVIFGDYDCDGTLAAVILRSTMRRLGHDARIYLPHRDEGYGFNSEAVHRFSRERMHLVITADNGINAEESVRLARRLGVDLLVVDHHQVESRSEALAVWSQDYSAAGLALMLSWGLFRKSWHFGRQRSRLLVEPEPAGRDRRDRRLCAAGWGDTYPDPTRSRSSSACPPPGPSQAYGTVRVLADFRSVFGADRLPPRSSYQCRGKSRPSGAGRRNA